MDFKNSKRTELTESAAVMFGRLVQTAREQRDISRYKLSKDLGLSDTSVRNIEEGKKFLSLDKIVIICRYFGWNKISFDFGNSVRVVKDD